MKVLIEKLKQGRFLVLGRAGMDLYPEPAGTKTEHADHMEAHLGGSSANIAVALVRHGCSASMVTRVSDDAIGRFCINKLNEFGVSTKHVLPVSGEYRTSLAIVESTTVDHQSVIYRNGAADFMMSVDDIKDIEMSDYDALVFTGTLLASENSREATRYALSEARKQGLVVVFDIDYRPYSWESGQKVSEVYQEFSLMSDIIIGNDDEFGLMAKNKSQGRTCAQAFSQRANTIVVYKMGAVGAVTFCDEQEILTGIYKVKALKPVGAGDAFMGGFLQSLVNGYDLRDSVLRGSACAAIVVSSLGCASAMPDQKTLSSFLKEHDTA